MNATRVQGARESLLRVLRGEWTPDNYPEYFDDDAFFMDVYLVERDNLQWLIECLEKGEYDPRRRMAIAIHLDSDYKRVICQRLMDELQRQAYN